jgi:hypothetical protein
VFSARNHPVSHCDGLERSIAKSTDNSFKNSMCGRSSSTNYGPANSVRFYCEGRKFFVQAVRPEGCAEVGIRQNGSVLLESRRIAGCASFVTVAKITGSPSLAKVRGFTL